MHALDRLFEVIEHPDFITLSKIDWCEYSMENDTCIVSLKKEVIRSLPPKVQKLLADSIQKVNARDVSVLYTYSRIAKYGPKILYPLASDCLAMENVQLTLPPSDYRQAYETIVIVFPEEYRSSLQSRFPKSKIPFLAISYVEPKTNFLQIILKYGKHQPEILFFCTQKADTLELALGEVSIDDDDFVVSRLLQRTVLNVNLFLYTFGTKLNPPKIKRNPPKAKDRVQMIEYEQHVMLKARSRSDISLGGSHASPHPHWRRGHERNQPYGKGKLLTKKIDIKPMFIGGEFQALRTSYQHV